MQIFETLIHSVNFKVMCSRCMSTLLFVFHALVSLTGQNSDELKQKLTRQLPSGERLETIRSLITLLISEDKALVKSVYLPMLHEEVMRSDNKEFAAYEAEVGANLLYLSGQIDSALVQYMRARDLYLTAGKKDKLLTTYCRAGIMYSLKGDYSRALQIYREVTAAGVDYPDVMALVNNQLGSVFHYQGVRDSALFYYKKSAVLYGVLKDSAGMMRPMFNSAVLLREEGKEQEALELLMTIKAWRERNKMYRDLYNTVNVISQIYTKMGRYEQALEYAEQAYGYAVRQNDDVLKVISLGNIANVCKETGEIDRAARYLEQALDFAESTGNTNDILQTMYRLGQLWLNAKRYDLSVEILEKARTVIAAKGTSRTTPTILVALGQAYLMQNKLDEARKYLKTGMGMAESMGQEHVKNDATGLMGRVYLRENRPYDAIRAADISYKSSVKEGFVVNQIENLSTLYDAYKMVGNYKEALSAYERYRTLSDSVNSIEQVKQLTVKTQQFEFNLEREKTMAEQRQRESLLQAEIKRNGIIAVAIGVLFLLMLFHFMNSRSKNRIISQKNEELESLNSVKDKLFAIIGHDLRSPVQSLHGLVRKVHYLIDRNEFELLNKLSVQIEQKVYSTLQLTDNLLIWAQSQRSAVKVKLVSVDMAEILRLTLAPLEPSAQNKQIELTVDEASFRVDTDSDIVQVIIRNLADNAVKFTKPGGSVRVSSGEFPGGFYVKVSDTGVGMSNEKIAGLFTSEGAGSDSGTMGEMGAGLGFSVVKEMTALLGGEVQVTSVEGEGTTVCIEIKTVAQQISPL
ncbi:MAG: hypothetical protein RJA20_2169 [Bacteroidota bacterium]|jgi:signal transduction histidine kinase